MLDELQRVPKQKKDIINYIYNYSKTDKEGLLKDLRYYTGSFPALKNYNDEQINDLIDYVQEQNFKQNDDWVYIKKGSKWMLTKNKEAYEFSGIKTYTKEEVEALKNAKAQKDLKSQQEEDKEISNILGGTTVCFGKGYKKEDLQQIRDATNNLVNDFDALSGYVSAMGDRTNLENYINARRAARQLSEDDIQNEIERVKKYTTFYGSDPESRYRQQAINNLTGNIKIQKEQRAYAYWCDATKMMIFMPKMRNAQESLKNDYESNFHPTGENISVYYHEMGHATDHMISKLTDSLRKKAFGDNYYKLHDIEVEYDKKMKEFRMQNYNKNYQEEFDKAFKEKYGFGNDMNAWENMRKQGKSLEYEKYMLKKELISKGIKEYNVSKYAATNNAEFLAECFAGYYCKAGNELCDNVVKATKTYYDKLKELENEL